MGGIQKKGFEDYRVAEDKFITFSSGSTTFDIAVNDQVVLVDATTDAGTVKLPPVDEARGYFYSIRKIGTGTKLVTITQNATSQTVGWSDFTDMNAVDDRRVLYSDGYTWHDVASTIAP